MSLYKPYFSCTQQLDGSVLIQHNCDGAISFCATDTVDEHTARLMFFAIEEGKRQLAKEIRTLCNYGEVR